MRLENRTRRVRSRNAIKKPPRQWPPRYVSAARSLKPLGFDGSKALDIKAAYNSHGFEFKVA
jgi:hypothetical protein